MTLSAGGIIPPARKIYSKAHADEEAAEDDEEEALEGDPQDRLARDLYQGAAAPLSPRVPGAGLESERGGQACRCRAILPGPVAPRRDDLAPAPGEARRDARAHGTAHDHGGGRLMTGDHLFWLTVTAVLCL